MENLSDREKWEVLRKLVGHNYLCSKDKCAVNNVRYNKNNIARLTSIIQNMGHNGIDYEKINEIVRISFYNQTKNLPEQCKNWQDKLSYQDLFKLFVLQNKYTEELSGSGKVRFSYELGQYLDDFYYYRSNYEDFFLDAPIQVGSLLSSKIFHTGKPKEKLSKDFNVLCDENRIEALAEVAIEMFTNCTYRNEKVEFKEFVENMNFGNFDKDVKDRLNSFEKTEEIEEVIREIESFKDKEEERKMEEEFFEKPFAEEEDYDEEYSGEEIIGYEEYAREKNREYFLKQKEFEEMKEYALKKSKEKKNATKAKQDDEIQPTLF